MIRKIRIIKRAIIEIIETLCTICLYLERESRSKQQGMNYHHFRSHFNELKHISEQLRGDNNDKEN